MRQISCYHVLLAICLSFSGCRFSGNGKEKVLKDVTKVSIMKSSFGKTGNKDVYLFTLTNRHGITVKITNYGGIITEILMPGKDQKTGNIVLGYDNLQAYVANSPYFGAIVGRYANRIAKGEFTLDGVTYKLARNNGNNALHGGIKGFDKVVWDAAEYSDTAAVRRSLAGDEPKQRGLTGAAGPHHGRDAAPLHCDVNAVEDSPGPHPVVDVAHVHHQIRLGGISH